jgi:hypothetical protein
MDAKRRNALMLHWSLVTAGGIALFWTIWLLATKEIPAISSIRYIGKMTWVLPFSIPRWWDILVGPIASILLVYLFYLLPEQRPSKRIRFEVICAMNIVWGIIVNGQYPQRSDLLSNLFSGAVLIFVWNRIVPPMLSDIQVEGELTIEESFLFLFAGLIMFSATYAVYRGFIFFFFSVIGIFLIWFIFYQIYAFLFRRGYLGRIKKWLSP